MQKIGINMHACKGMTDKEYIQRIAALGFGATFSMPYDIKRQTEIADLCAVNGIRYETLHAPFDHINDIWFEGESGDAMLRELTDCVDLCNVAGANIAVVHLSAGDPAPPVTDIGRARFEQLVNYAAKKQVRIAFENQRKLANLAWALETFGEDVAGFCWDCGHEACFTPGREYMPLFGERLICTHLHDNTAVYNADDHMLPFDGAINFERIAAHLQQSSFDGTLMLEVMAYASDRYEGISADVYLERAAAAAKHLATIV